MSQRSRRDAALWARVARLGTTDPAADGTAANDAQYLTVDGAGALLVTAPSGGATETTLAGVAREATLKARFGVTLGGPTTVTAAGSTTVHTPAAGKRVRLRWVGLSTPETNPSPTVAEIGWIDGATIYRWAMGVPMAFAHGSVREGAVDQALVATLSVAATLYVNLDVEEF